MLFLVPCDDRYPHGFIGEDVAIVLLLRVHSVAGLTVDVDINTITQANEIRNFEMLVWISWHHVLNHVMYLWIQSTTTTVDSFLNHPCIEQYL